MHKMIDQAAFPQLGWAGAKGGGQGGFPVSPVISEFFTNGYALRHQLCESTLFKKKMIESSPILEVREKKKKLQRQYLLICGLFGTAIISLQPRLQGRLPELPTRERLWPLRQF